MTRTGRSNAVNCCRVAAHGFDDLCARAALAPGERRGDGQGARRARATPRCGGQPIKETPPVTSTMSGRAAVLPPVDK
nr:hypothetical protein asmbl_25 [uncultured bacterium]